MTAHTPGPWNVGFPEGVRSFWSDRNEGYVSVCAGCPPFAFGAAVAMVDGDANARLISAAPEMLEALEAAVECGMVPKSSAAEGGALRHSRQVHVADMIRAAIAKATVAT